ncbi:MAG: YdeI/OmpD-associated family protein [Acidobacteria bacterium]|nr:YdeI/OmpD-associated family protein [Acidobacteriota bacterium]
MNVTFFKSATDLHKWLEANHDKIQELVVGFYKKSSGKPSITYPEALDEALCFGWIDGVRKTIDDISYSIRFSPRRPKSIWSLVNTRRAEGLKKLGRMKSSGLAAFEKRNRDATARLFSTETRNLQLAGEYEKKFRANKKAWAFFEKLPPGYRRRVMLWVMSAKQSETQLRRLSKLIADCETGRRGGP